MTKVITPTDARLLPMPENIDWATHYLLAGHVIAIPTETVYGLAALAHIPHAVDQIFHLKNRPTHHPLIVHIAHAHDISHFAVTDLAFEKANRLAQAFWPGPLTFIMNKQNHIPNNITGGQDTIALRCPNHPITLRLLENIRAHSPNTYVGLAAPSANRFGKVSPTLAQHVITEFAGAIPVLDGGACQCGIESTILDLTQPQATILRPGLISAQDIELILQEPVVYHHEATDTGVRAPGQLLAHYAPNTPVRLIDDLTLIPNALEPLSSCVVYSLSPCPQAIQSKGLPTWHWVTAPQTAAAYAQTLYQRLRQFDDQGYQQIILHLPATLPNDWRGILDRVRKAAATFSTDLTKSTSP